jgi:hypothetical protein
MVAHGLTNCARVYRIPDGVKYLVFCDEQDYRGGEMLQFLKGAAVQIVRGEYSEDVFVWPETADGVAGDDGPATSINPA